LNDAANAETVGVDGVEVDVADLVLDERVPDADEAG